MSRRIQPLRLTPEAAGTLQAAHTKATTDLREMTRFRKEFDRQLTAMIGHAAMRQLRKDTERALLLADLVKEAA
ncbi:hypothetical protein ALQ04_01645 [Pseudomonas cichorii]|uniref:Uncharacterized protein n=1 Tax=Pseudomonas cichorii TaxID=36746 RepID=A0A3M4LWY3_PSECI|nr:hypothetical protein [Pseudomonas cichorii]RMQ45996.1 hypothetical protein ALQ04_01645 [Pseudomonas cichorii]